MRQAAPIAFTKIQRQARVATRKLLERALARSVR